MAHEIWRKKELRIRD